MQTFLCEPTFELTAEHLDYRRLGKQRVEAYQILQILLGNTTSNAWKNHPAVRMWRGYELELADYMNCMIREWKKRGYKNTMKEYFLPIGYRRRTPCFYTKKFIDAHRSNLLRKDEVFYSQYKWKVERGLEYIWG